MRHKTGAEKSPCKVISLKNYKDKLVKNVSSTVAAIIAIKIEHPSDMTPEDFFLNEIEAVENIEMLAFEDALEDLIDNSQIDNSKNSKNFVNDA